MLKFCEKKIKHRLLQSTFSLMKEIGGVVNCGKTYDKKPRRYAWKNNGANILGIAHCDTRNCGSDHVFFDKNNVWSSRLDDRLGIYVLLDVLPKLGIKTDILLTDFEERSDTTAQQFECDKKYNWMYQFDRSGTDVVTYEYTEIRDKLSKFFKLGLGTFSDISFLNHLGICGFNVGTAYYNEHSLGSYADLKQLKSQINSFKSFYSKYKKISIPHKVYVHTNTDYDEIRYYRPKNNKSNIVDDQYDFDMSLWNDPTRDEEEIYDNWPINSWEKFK